MLRLPKAKRIKGLLQPCLKWEVHRCANIVDNTIWAIAMGVQEANMVAQRNADIAIRWVRWRPCWKIQKQMLLLLGIRSGWIVWMSDSQLNSFLTGVSFPHASHTAETSGQKNKPLQERMNFNWGSTVLYMLLNSQFYMYDFQTLVVKTTPSLPKGLKLLI